VEEDTTVEAMQRALDEGGPFDQKLTKLAEEEITPALLSAEEADESEEEESGNESTGDGAGSRRRKDNRSEQRTGR